jgi:hypothetical protein
MAWKCCFWVQLYRSKPRWISWRFPVLKAIHPSAQFPEITDSKVPTLEAVCYGCSCFIHLYNIRSLPTWQCRVASWGWWPAKRLIQGVSHSRRGLKSRVAYRLPSPYAKLSLSSLPLLVDDLVWLLVHFRRSPTCKCRGSPLFMFGQPGEIVDSKLPSLGWRSRSRCISWHRYWPHLSVPSAEFADSKVPCSFMHADARMERHMYPKWGLRGPEPRVDLHPGMAKYELSTTGSSPMQTVSSIV